MDVTEALATTTSVVTDQYLTMCASFHDVLFDVSSRIVGPPGLEFVAMCQRMKGLAVLPISQALMLPRSTLLLTSIVSTISLIKSHSYLFFQNFIRSHHGYTVDSGSHIDSWAYHCRAPELVDDEATQPTPSADIWSLAAVLLQCLTGRKPYEGMSSMQMRRALLLRHAPGAIPGDIPNGLQQLLRRCFHETPNQRPALAQIKQVRKATCVGARSLQFAKLGCHHIGNMKHSKGSWLSSCWYSLLTLE